MTLEHAMNEAARLTGRHDVEPTVVRFEKLYRGKWVPIRVNGVEQYSIRFSADVAVDGKYRWVPVA